MRIDVAFQVPYRYPVFFTNDLFSGSSSEPNGSTDTAKFLKGIEPQVGDLIIDKGVIESRPDRLERLADYWTIDSPLVLDGGESIKDDSHLIDQLHERWIQLGLDRHSVVLLVGGGSFLDATGFAATLFHRGIRHVRFPTTVLAQNDAGIGVKNGQNRFEQKNLLGSFQPPLAVVNESEFLATLEPRDYFSGFAEAVKVALIRSREFFDWLVSNADSLAAQSQAEVEYLISQCAALHLKQISFGGDPFESGSSRPLDFGHWIAHKLEVLTDHQLNHGEAVSIGLAVDTALSVEKGILSEVHLPEVVGLLKKFNLPVWHEVLGEIESDKDNAFEQVFSGMEDFRRHLGGELCIELLAGVGRGIPVKEVCRLEVFSALMKLKGLQ